MSILRVANLQFNASGTKRIDYDATNDDGIIKVSADAIRLPVGDTASRPNSQAGMIRYNSDLGLFEGANSTAWGSIGGVVDLTAANNYANTVGASSNSYVDMNFPKLDANGQFQYDIGMLGGSFGGTYINFYTNGNSLTGAAQMVMDTGNVFSLYYAGNYGTYYGPDGSFTVGGSNPNTNKRFIVDRTGNTTIISANLTVAGSNVISTIDSAFTKANSALQNSSLTLAGSLTTTDYMAANGYLFVTASDAGNEGGEIRLNGAGNYTGWALDVWQNNHRTFVTTGSTLANVNYFHAGGGSVRMGINKADPLYTLDVNGPLNTSSRGITKASMPSGSVLQVVNTLKTDTMTSGTSETWLDVTGMSATITPTSATSTIFVQVFVGRFAGTNSVVWRVLRNGSLFNAGAAAGSRLQIHAAESNQGRDSNHTGQVIIGYIDSPATTSSLTYQLQFRQEGTNFCFNRNNNDADAARSYDSRSSSSMILMEIAQ